LVGAQRLELWTR